MIRVLGAGWYGCHITAALAREGYDVELHELTQSLFAGASGANPARLHLGLHYPRSRLTRAACLEHAERFRLSYGHLTRAVPVNIYAVAAHDSMVDFGTYLQVLQGEVPIIPIDPAEFGLTSCEGAVLTGERHIVIDEARAHFEKSIGHLVKYGVEPGLVDDPAYELTVDCTFCANDAEAIDRYEPCLTVLLEGPTDRAVTIMDGPFPSVYPWNERLGLCSLTSARLTPLAKDCRSYAEAKDRIRDALASPALLGARCVDMLDQMGQFWPAVRDLFKIADFRLSVRAMPRSGADARLVDVVPIGDRALRVRAGKIDAVFRAEALVMERLGCRRLGNGSVTSGASPLQILADMRRSRSATVALSPSPRLPAV